LEQANGPKPTLEDRVKVHYRAFRINGREFESSYDRGEPSVFSLAGTVEGWKEGVQLMSVGSRWRFYIPSDLAYGEPGYRGFIQPNDTLIYEIELLGIEDMHTSR
jgi:FKBP-type peptidyl-prolyl cis-trans isomerase